MIVSNYDCSQLFISIADNQRERDMSACDVAIVGLGPVGATAALLLAEQGLQVTVFESAREIYPLPRAVNLDGEIIRAFQGIGRGDAVQALMQALRPDERAGFADADRQWMFGQTHRAFGPNGWQTTNMFDQPELEQYLRDEIEQHDRIRVHLGTEVTGFREINGENADAKTRIEIDTCTDGGDIKTERARWMIGCDGASSFVRRSLDIGWRSQGYDCDWLVVDVTVRPGHTLPNDTLQVCDPDRITTYVCTKEPYRRWEFKLNEGETADEMMQEEMIRSLIDPWTPRGTYDIRRAAVYQFHAATADQWREGDVFIAGDAAHQPHLGRHVAPDLFGRDVDLDRLHVLVEARRQAEVHDPVEACAHQEDDIGLFQRQRARSAHGKRIVIGQNTFAHR